MRRALLVVGVALLVLGGTLGLAAMGLHLAWEKVPPPPDVERPSASLAPSIPTFLVTPDCGWAFCRITPPRQLGFETTGWSTRLVKGERDEQ